MRTFVLMLMIALLPLRMWAAEGMAVRMVQQEVQASAMPAMDSMPEDCPMMAKAHADLGSQDKTSPTAHCMACHLCAAFASLPVPAFAQGLAPSGPPESRASAYPSAIVAPGLRPPIS